MFIKIKKIEHLLKIKENETKEMLARKKFDSQFIKAGVLVT